MKDPLIDALEEKMGMRRGIINELICLPEWSHEWLIPLTIEPDYSFEKREIDSYPTQQVVAVYRPYKELSRGLFYHKFVGVRVINKWEPK